VTQVKSDSSLRKTRLEANPRPARRASDSEKAHRIQGEVRGVAFIAEVAPLLRESNLTVWGNVKRFLAEMGEKGEAFAEQLIPQLLEDSNPALRSNAARFLAEMGEKGAAFAGELIPLLRDGDPMVRGNAVYAFGMMGEKGAVFAEEVIPLLRDEDPTIRGNAVWALGTMGAAPAYAEQLVHMLEDPAPVVCSNALRLLEKMGRRGADFSEKLIPLLRNEDPEVRVDAVVALKGMGAVFAKKITPLLEDQELRVRQAAAVALAEMGAEDTILPKTSSKQQHHAKVEPVKGEGLVKREVGKRGRGGQEAQAESERRSSGQGAKDYEAAMGSSSLSLADSSEVAKTKVQEERNKIAKNLIKKFELSQSELARETGYTSQFINMVERGNANAPLPFIKHLELLLRVKKGI